jgi:hypothetical protein
VWVALAAEVYDVPAGEIENVFGKVFDNLLAHDAKPSDLDVIEMIAVAG